MELSKQVISLSLAKRLKELGVKKQSWFFWISLRDKNAETEFELCFAKDKRLQKVDVYEWYAAYTVAELGEMLPGGLPGRNGYSGTTLHIGRKYPDEWFCGYSHVMAYGLNEPTYFHWDCGEEGKTEAEARGRMLVYLLENKLI